MTDRVTRDELETAIRLMRQRKIAARKNNHGLVDEIDRKLDRLAQDHIDRMLANLTHLQPPFPTDEEADRQEAGREAREQWFFTYNAHVDEDGMTVAAAAASIEYDALLRDYGYDSETIEEQGR